MTCSKHLILIALSLIGTLIFSGCGKRIPNAEQAAEQNIFLMGNGAEPESIDPHLFTGHPDATIIGALIEGLIAHEEFDNNVPEPGLAESWESLENSKRWILKIRDDAKWSNGDPVLASDFVYSYKRVLSAALASEFAPMLYLMENAKAYHTGEIKDFSQVGVKAIDNRTLEFNLIGPSPHFLSMLTHPTWYPVHQDTIESFGGIDNRISKWTRPGNYVGTGPFILEEWVTNQIIKVKKNPLYWDADNVKLEGIYFFPIADLHTEFRSFENGQLHKTNELPSDLIESVKGKPSYRNDPALIVYYYMINTTRPPLDDIRVSTADQLRTTSSVAAKLRRLDTLRLGS